MKRKKYFYLTTTIFLLILNAINASCIFSNSPSEPLLFLGNHILPPMIYTQDDKSVGIVVDLVEAIKKRMKRPVKTIYMDWTEAQRMVLKGEADALLQINATEERRKIYDFSDTLLESEFSTFTSTDTKNIFNIDDLKGLKVGVEKKGLPIILLKKHPAINLKIIPDIVTGFNMLVEREIDTIVVDRAVGLFVLAENEIRGIKATFSIDKSRSMIAVKKGNSELLAEINKALAEIKEDRTYNEILAKWESKEVVYQTKEQYERQKYILLSILFVTIVTSIWLIILIKEINKRKKTEYKLRLAKESAESASKELRRMNEMITQDLLVAQSIQQRLFSEYKNPPYLKIVIRYLPHLHVSGDIYKIYPYKNGTYNIFLGDSTGHGVAAALSTVMANTILLEQRQASLVQIMEHLNEIFEQHLPIERFMSAILININQQGELRAIIAGHPPLIVIPFDEREPILIKAKVTMLGILPKSVFKVQEDKYTLKQGDKVILYTDGIYERESSTGEIFGMNNLYLFLKENRECDLKEQIFRLEEHINTFSQGKKTKDDITIVAFEYQP